MSYRLERLTSTLSISAINEANQSEKFDLNPPYQRKSIWDDDRQSFFIDSLLRNYPIPPIFLKRIIDDTTGNTRFEVVDGKQRLTSIFRFIANEIPASNEDEEDPIAPFVGKYFKDLDLPEYILYKKNFWRYPIPVEYIDDISEPEMNNIFDRLNRNGMPLSKQELRNAKFYTSKFIAFLRDMASLPFWRTTLEPIAGRDRSEDIELMADFAFVLLENDVKQVEGQRFDELFDKWARALDGSLDNLVSLRDKFTQATDTFEELQLDLGTLRLRGTSHLYGIWSLLCMLQINEISTIDVGNQLKAFFALERSSQSPNESMREYFNGTTARTRSRASRIKRLKALAKYLHISIDDVKFFK
jgi:hypothetical protein